MDLMSQIATSRIRFGLAFQENYSYFCAKGELNMIGYKRTKQECKGEQAAKVSKKLALDKTRKDTGDAVKMPEKFSVVWK